MLFQEKETSTYLFLQSMVSQNLNRNTLYIHVITEQLVMSEFPLVCL